MAHSSLYMTPRRGYAVKTMQNACAQAGFAGLGVVRRPSKYDLRVVATTTQQTEEDLQALVKIYIAPV